MSRSVPDRRTFAELARSRRRGHAGGVRVVWVPGQPGEPRRVAFAVGRKVGNAVQRNRVRRRLRAIVRELDLPPGAYLVQVMPQAAALTYWELQENVKQAAAGATATRVGRIEGDHP